MDVHDRILAQHVAPSALVPDGVPVITRKPGDRSLLVPGAKVMVTAENRNGQPTASD